MRAVLSFVSFLWFHLLTFFSRVCFLVLFPGLPSVTPLEKVTLAFHTHPEEDHGQPEAEERFLMKSDWSSRWEPGLQSFLSTSRENQAENWL